MTPISIPLDCTGIPSKGVYLFTPPSDCAQRIDRLFLHPRWGMSLNVEIHSYRRFQLVNEPGWRFLPFTVDNVPAMQKWVDEQARVLYQKERKELADFLKGVTWFGEGMLRQPILHIPGMYLEVKLTNIGKEDIPETTIGVLLGERLTPSEAVEEERAEFDKWWGEVRRN